MLRAILLSSCLVAACLALPSAPRHQAVRTHLNTEALKAMNETMPPANCPGWAMYKQCDSRWGSNRLGTSGDTICSAGCAMSSLAMVLTTRGGSYNPGSLNDWLNRNGGFEGGDELVWGAADKTGLVAFQGIEQVDAGTLASGISQCHGIIANVRGGSHWVLLTGYQGNNVFTVNDPGFNQATYNFGDIQRVAVYH